MKLSSLFRRSLVTGGLGLLAACSNGTDGRFAPLAAECVDTRASAPEHAWFCVEPRTVECSDPAGTAVDFVFVAEDENDTSCAQSSFEVSDEGPFALGVHTVDVESVATASGDRARVCTSTLTIVDTTPPVITPKSTELWPPNHKMHRIAPRDCVDVRDACDEDVQIHFLWASSDEVQNGQGDGNHEPDIQDLDCDGVSLRSERSGNGDGRVYRLGYRAFDAAGNETEGECEVIVPHDRSGRTAVDSGEAHRVELSSGASCNPNNP